MILPKKQKSQKINSKMLKVKEDVSNFLVRKENIRMCPGKKDDIKSKSGQIEQKQMLCVTLSNLHQTY